MKSITLIFPNQLFKQQPAVKEGREVYLVEDELFFRQYKFHKQKLALHRASMKFYASHLQSQGYTVKYIDSSKPLTLKALFDVFLDGQIQEVHTVEPIDYLLKRRLKRFSLSTNITLVFYDSPNFICSSEYLHQYFNSKKRYYLTEFYIEQRKRLSILINNEKPVGNKWTFDTENRKKMPASVAVPSLPVVEPTALATEAKDYVNTNFKNNYGTLQHFNYPHTYEQAKENLQWFLTERFIYYGIYQDALVARNSFLFHSLITPALNIGLIDPTEIIDTTLAFAEKNNIPLNSLEGFVRQIIGWREFIRAVYIRESVKERTANHWQHTGKIPACFWTGNTGIEPVDNVIQKVLKTGYSNHIERLMVLGNFMLLCEFHPDEVYRWFMELYIDAYDWVMVPNVYGMSQFADGGLMATKPYISGSNYILKMSDFKKGYWCEVWDALYWCFIEKHKIEFSKNPRMSMMVRQVEKMDALRLAHLKETKEKFLLNLK